MNDVAPERPDLGPAADDAHRWETRSSELKIYCLVRTLVSAIRLEAELRIFDGDSRVKLIWVVCPGSRFEHGLRDWFDRRKLSVITLDQAKRGSWDLVITTSEWIDVSCFAPKPVILVPHGLGFHKYVRDPDTNRLRLSGLARPESLRKRHVVQVVTHTNQERQLAEVTEDVIGRTALGGDSSFDLLLNSRGERATYRAALGVTDKQRLITLGSTWGPDSLCHQRFELFGRLLGELPFEQYRVAAFMHPAAWSFDGETIVRHLQPHIDSGGLMLIGPEEGWHGTLLASDLLIGDNGSPSLYGAMMGIPLLLATFSDNVVPGTVMAELGRSARFLNPDLDLRQQIEDELVRHDSARAEVLTAQMIERPGESAELLRALCYTKAGLPVPDDELPVHAAPLPEPKAGEVKSFRVHSYVDTDSTVVVDTYPAVFRDSRRHSGERLLVQLGERNLRRYHNAAIILDPKPLPRAALRDHLTELIEKYIGSRIAVVACDDGGCEILVRDGEQFHVTCGGGLPIRVLACACYALLVAQRELNGEVVVRTSNAEAPMTVARSAAMV